MKLKALITISSIAFLTGCGGGGSETPAAPSATDTSIKITGQLSGASASMFAAASSSPDKLMILVDFEDVVEIPVNSDGTFTINKGDITGNILTIFPVNEGSGKVYSNIKLGATTSDNLDAINMSNLDSSLSLGSIDLTSNTTATATVDSSNAFKSDKISEVKQLSRNDNGLAMYENGLRNENIEVYVDIVFSDDFSSVNNQYSTITSPVANKYKGIRPRFYLDKTVYNGVSNVDLYSPSSINRSQNNATSTPVNIVMSDTTPYTAVVHSSSQILTVEAAFVDSLPSGDWLLKDDANDNQLGSFTLQAATPFDSTNMFLGVIPKVKIISNGSGDITSVEVKLYTEGSDGSITQVSQSYLKQMINIDNNGLVFSYVMDNSGGSSSNFTFDDEGSTEDVLSFKTSSSVNVNNMARIIFSYSIGGSKYQFFFE